MGALIRANEIENTRALETEALVHGQQYLTFMVGDEMLAIPINVIKEIIEYCEPTTVPMMPESIRGIINLRGRVVPLVDLQLRFGRPSIETSRRTCFIIIEVEYDDEQQYLGVVVDSVAAVVDIPDADIEPTPSFGAKLRNDFISGMGKIGEQFVIILDINHVLSIEELSVLAEINDEPVATAGAIEPGTPPAH